jgi:hypothetical protein
MAHEFDKPLTVKDLKEILFALPDDMQILTSSIPEGAQSDWFNINSVALPAPDDYSDYSAVTLFLANTYDPRQF